MKKGHTHNTTKLHPLFSLMTERELLKTTAYSLPTAFGSALLWIHQKLWKCSLFYGIILPIGVCPLIKRGFSYRKSA